MRRFFSQFAAVILVSGTLAPVAAGSVPAVNATREIHASLQEAKVGNAQELILPEDGHPFATEFYLQGLEDSNLMLESPPARPQHSFMRLRPVTAAASNLSRIVASWRHAIAHLMPTP